MEAGAEPRHLWEADGGLRGCSPRQNGGARRPATGKRGSVGVTGRRAGCEARDRRGSLEGPGRRSVREGWSRLPKLGQWLRGRPPLSRVRRRRCGGVVGGLGKGRGELGRRDRCHHCRRLRPGGTPSLRRRRHLVTPAPANTKCPQSRGAASSRRRARWERELGRSLGRVGCEPEGGTGSARGAAHTRPSVTPSPPRGACALPCLRTAQACCGLASFPPPRPPPPSQGRGSLPLPAVCGSALLATCEVSADPEACAGLCVRESPPRFFLYPNVASGSVWSLWEWSVDLYSAFEAVSNL